MPKWVKWAYALIFLLAVSVRCVDVWRAVDGTVRDLWREIDVASIARNFYLESMDITLPRIDWRGDGPGITESEFPLHAWTAACLYHVFGYHEELLRVISCALSIATAALFFRIAIERLPTIGALIACLFFAVNPMSVRMATAIQPEPLMFFAYLSAVYCFLKWCELASSLDQLKASNAEPPEKTPGSLSHQQLIQRYFGWGMVATALAILAKIPAAHIGVLFACLSFHHFGLKAVLRRDVWIFAIIAVGIPLAWYAYARSLYLAYGNSLGMSNEAYVRISSGNFLRTLSITMPGNGLTELEWIWMRGGAVLGTLGFALMWREKRHAWIGYWGVALLAFYIVAGRTTGEIWAIHYHIVSVPVAALCVGYAVEKLLQMSVPKTAPAKISIPTWLRTSLLLAGLLTMLEALFEEIRTIKWNMNPETYVWLYDEAHEFQAHMEPNTLIVASGGSEFDQFGLLRAINAPFYFFWTDHKGFTLPDADQTVPKLEELRRRGARYFVADRKSLIAAPDFNQQLHSKYSILASGKQAILFDLNTAPQAVKHQTVGRDNSAQSEQSS